MTKFVRLGYHRNMIFQTEINYALEVIQTHAHVVLDYGPFFLFILLALGIIALPIPDETLMLTAGFLISRGKLPMIFTAAAAYLGAICGITISYLIGRFGGYFLVQKYGCYIGLTEKRVERTRHWFSRIGIWTLFVGYFIPGVRHFTGYLIGTVRISFFLFALFAYSGAAVWASVFLVAGYLLGNLTL